MKHDNPVVEGIKQRSRILPTLPPDLQSKIIPALELVGGRRMNDSFLVSKLCEAARVVRPDANQIARVLGELGVVVSDGADRLIIVDAEKANRLLNRAAGVAEVELGNGSDEESNQHSGPASNGSDSLIDQAVAAARCGPARISAQYLAKQLGIDATKARELTAIMRERGHITGPGHNKLRRPLDGNAASY